MKPSKFYLTMLILAIISLILAIISLKFNSPDASAMLFTSAFIFWYVSAMLPKWEKYTDT